jgi:hypothetical protein
LKLNVLYMKDAEIIICFIVSYMIINKLCVK